jgi:hypothetical protein
MLDFDITGKIRRSTLYNVEFPTLPTLKLRPTTATLQQKQYFHDILTLEYEGITNASVETINTGIPVKFTWSQGSREKVWYGYVAYVSRLSASQKKRPITIRCVGASFVLKKKVAKTYKKKTVPEVAALIAKEHGLKFVGENHSRRFAQLSIAGQSQWEWLHQNAARIGYAMYVTETSLVFKPVDVLLDEFLADTPLYQFWSDNFPRLDYQLDRTLDSFSVLKGEFLEDGSPQRTNKIVGGVDPITSRSFSERTSPKETGVPLRTQISDVLFDGFASEEVANSKLAAKLASKGAAELARFNLPAKIVGQGDPRVFPYRMIYIDGINREFNGHWLVREITHQFKFGGDYGVTMEVATDGVKDNARGTRNPRSRTSQVSTFGKGPNSGARRRLSRRGVGTLDVSKLLGRNGAFAISSSFTGAVDLSAVVDTAPRYSKPKENTKLVAKSPYLTSVNTQGFNRTPTLWRNTAPSSSSISSANLGRKCS